MVIISDVNIIEKIKGGQWVILVSPQNVQRYFIRASWEHFLFLLIYYLLIY